MQCRLSRRRRGPAGGNERPPHDRCRPETPTAPPRIQSGAQRLP